MSIHSLAGLLSVLALAVMKTTSYAGDELAREACRCGAPPGVFRCVSDRDPMPPQRTDHLQLSDVSFAHCNGGNEIEQFVAPGTCCVRKEQGNDWTENVYPSPCTTTRVYEPCNTRGDIYVWY